MFAKYSISSLHNVSGECKYFLAVDDIYKRSSKKKNKLENMPHCKNINLTNNVANVQHNQIIILRPKVITKCMVL